MQKQDLRAFGFALILYGLFYTGFFLKSLVSGNYIAPSDSLDFGLSAFLSPQTLWTDTMYSGYPIAADPQALTWYPLFQLIRVLGLGWNSFMIAPYIVASAGCFLLVRRLTGSNMAGAFAGFVYGFSGVMLAHISHFNQIHAASWLPLVVYGLQLTREGHGRAGVLVGSIACALMWMSGHPQVAVYTLYVAAAATIGWCLIDRPERSTLLPRLTWSVIMLGLGLGLAAIMILPMVELGEFSRRATRNWELYTSKPLPPWQLLSLVFPLGFGGFWTSTGTLVPYFGESSPGEMTGYVGLLPLSLALAGPFLRSPFRKEALLWLIVASIAALLCLGAATPIGTMFFYAPGYAAFRVPARHFFVVTFSLAVASGLAFAELTARLERRGTLAGAVSAVFLVGTFAATFFVWGHPDVQHLVARNQTYVAWALVMPLVIASLLVAGAVLSKLIGHDSRTSPLVFAGFLIAVHLGEMAIFHYMLPGYRFEYAEVPLDRVVPRPRMAALGAELHRTGERILAVDGSRSRFLLPNLTRAWDVPGATGSGSLGIERYLDVLGMGGPGDVYPDTLSENHQGIDLFAIRYALVPQRSPMIDDLRHQGDRWSAIEDLRYRDDDPETYYTLFRNERARPRAWCASHAVGTSADQALAAIRSGRLPDGRHFSPTETVLTEDEVAQAPNAIPPGVQGSSAVIATSVNRRERRYLVRSSSCLLVLSEVYYPWWRASIDHAPVSVSRVNHTMVGISVPAGVHVVRLWLFPSTVWGGAALSLIALLTWIGLATLPTGPRSILTLENSKKS